MPTFKPPTDGFRFSNGKIKWSVDLIVVPFVYGSTQLCGGVVYAALDYFLNSVPIPTMTTPPEEGTTLHTYIFDRQVIAHQNTLARFLMWFSRPDALQITMSKYIAQLKDALDSRGRPVPFCIVRGPFHGHHLLALGCEGESPVTIKAYDPNYPNLTVTLTGDASTGLDHSNADHAYGFFVDDGYAPAPNPPKVGITGSLNLLPRESDWRWCSKCNALFYNGGKYIGVCPSGGPHVGAGKKVYRLNTGFGAGEKGWKWCRVCQSLFWPGHANGGVCPKGMGRHDRTDGTDYTVANGSANGDNENGWRYCRACAILYYGGAGGRSVCPAPSGSHDKSSTVDYSLAFWEPAK